MRKLGQIPNKLFVVHEKARSDSLFTLANLSASPLENVNRAVLDANFTMGHQAMLTLSPWRVYKIYCLDHFDQDDKINLTYCFWLCYNYLTQFPQRKRTFYNFEVAPFKVKFVQKIKAKNTM